MTPENAASELCSQGWEVVSRYVENLISRRKLAPWIFTEDNSAGIWSVGLWSELQPVGGTSAFELNFSF